MRELPQHPPAKNTNRETDSYHTRMAEMSVSCESCHGPMKSHVDWQAKKPANETKDPTLKPFSRDQMLETCAACHARRGEVTGDMVPGESFYDHFNLTVPDGSDLFYADGQVHEEDYEFTAFLGSKMHAAGVRCVDCHDPHTGKRVLVGNALCMQCHSGGAPRPGITKPAPVIDPVAHSHHGEASTGNLCTSCHMPVTDYMQRHPRHDHGYTIPDPVMTKEYGIPNACSRCHTDKDVKWAMDATEKWYGEKMNRPTRTRTDLFSRAKLGDPASRQQLIDFLKQPNEPLWQTSAVHLLGTWAGEPAATAALLAQFKHPSPLVREAAVRSGGSLALEGDESTKAALKPLLEDPARSVRVAAAWMLRDTLDPESRAGTELLHMLRIGADQPIGQMQLGQYEFARKNPTVALGHFRKAVEWDPNSAPFHHDLAVALSASGDTSGAIRELQQAVKLAPEMAEYHYKLALAWNEAGSLPNAIASLEETVSRDPDMGRAWYHVAVAYAQAGRKQQAMEAAQRALSLNPQDPRVLQLMKSLR
ncbi:MAG: tetratricopeptide repeat protein [Luteolibacter sp.]